MLTRLGKDVAIYGAGDFLFKFVAFAVFPIYAYVFSVAEFGVWALLTAAAGLLGVLMNLGINNAVQRFYWDPETRPEEQPLVVSAGLFQLLLWGACVVALAFILLAPAADRLRTEYGIEWTVLLLALAWSLPDQLLQFTLDAIRLHFTPLRFLLVAFAKNLLGVGIGLWLVLDMGWGLRGLFLGLLVGSLVPIPLAFWFIRKDLILSWDKAIARRLFAFGFPFLFTGIAYWLFTSLDRWMLAELSDAEQVGLYSAASKYAAVVTFIITAFAQAWSPFAIKLMRDDPDYRDHYSRIFSLWFFLLAMVGLGIALFSPEGLMLLTPPEYWGAANVLPALAVGLVLFGTTQITALGISLRKRTAFLTYGAWMAAAANLALNLVLTPRYGALGAAIASLGSYAVLTSVFLFWSQRLHPIPLEKGKLLYSLLLVLLALACTRLDLVAPTVTVAALKAALLLLACGGAFAVGILDRGLFNFVRTKGAF
jgi:O-antigen/teichoic acid export membrane protein